MKNSGRVPVATCSAEALPADAAQAAGQDGMSVASWDEWFTPWRFAGLLCLFIFAAYPEVVFGSHTFFYRDYGVFGYPLAHHHRTAFWSGEFPLWNPLSNCGLPHFAQWNTMVLYPLSIIYLALPMPWALGFYCLGHLFLAGLGMYWLAHRWTANRFAATVAGLGYALNGLMLHSLMWPNNIAALAWMPFVVLLMERAAREGMRALPFAVLVGAIQMLSGAPEVILFTWLLAAAVCVTVRESCWRRRCSSFGLAGLLVAALTAVQLLPFLDLVAQSQRDRDYSTDAWAMPPWGWANLLVPLFHCTPSVIGVYSQDAQQWTSSYYVGIGVTALALLGATRWRDRRCLVLGIAALLSLWLALGSAGGLHTALKKFIPLFGLVRFPIKFVVVAVFALPLLAALALARWQAADGNERGRLRRCWIRIGLILVAAAACVVVVARLHPVPDEQWLVTCRSGVTRAALLSAVLLGVIGLARTHGARGLWLRLGLLMALGVDSLTHMPRQNPVVRVETLAEGAVTREWTSTEGYRAMVSPRMQSFLEGAATADAEEFCRGQRRALYPNWNLVDGIASVGGFYSLYTAAQADVRGIWTGKSNMPPALADFLGVRWISSDTELFAWNQRTTALPLVTAGQRPVFAGRQETLQALAARDFDPLREVYLPQALQGGVRAVQQLDTRVLNCRFGSGSLEVEVESPAPALLTIAQSASPGWNATVNGHTTLLWTANHAFQALEVPAGRSRVRLVYRERTLGWGAAISLAGFMGCLALWWRTRRTKGESGG
jgi:hypothetical protein